MTSKRQCTGSWARKVTLLTCQQTTPAVATQARACGYTPLVDCSRTSEDACCSSSAHLWSLLVRVNSPRMGTIALTLLYGLALGLDSCPNVMGGPKEGHDDGAVQADTIVTVPRRRLSGIPSCIIAGPETCYGARRHHCQHRGANGDTDLDLYAQDDLPKSLLSIYSLPFSLADTIQPNPINPHYS